MTRIAVIGNAGGGKSTLCQKLSKARGLPFFAIDQIQWKPGWVPASAEEVSREHTNLLTKDRWIIDGWGGWDNILARFAAADTIIFIDHPLWIHYWWASKRQFMCLFRPRPDGPPGCPMLPMTWPLLKMIWAIHKEGRPKILNAVNALGNEKRIFHIRSPKELHSFEKQYCQAIE